MLNRKEVLGEIIRLSTLKELVEAYEEIAAMRMRRIRSTVLRARDFLEGLTTIFQEVKSSYKKQILALMKEKKIKNTSKLSVVKRNGKTVCILLSSNTGLYGDIVKKTFLLFNDYVNKNQADIILIGRLGKLLFEQQNKNKKFNYYEFPDSGIDKDSLVKLIENVVEYERILVFYGKFKNIVYQDATMLDIYGDPSLTDEPEKDDNKTGTNQVAYFFEPTLEEVLKFFEGQMFGSIFEQSVSESDLAKYAARMFTLDKATENIRVRFKRVEFQRRLIHHRSMNKKQLESLSGLTLWKKR